jgi:hypothetical protein
MLTRHRLVSVVGRRNARLCGHAFASQALAGMAAGGYDVGVPAAGGAQVLKSFRRLRYRVDRTAASFHALVSLAVLVLCGRRLITPSRARIPA